MNLRSKESIRSYSKSKGLIVYTYTIKFSCRLNVYTLFDSITKQLGELDPDWEISGSGRFHDRLNVGFNTVVTTNDKETLDTLIKKAVEENESKFNGLEEWEAEIIECNEEHIYKENNYKLNNSRINVRSSNVHRNNRTLSR